jgi:hypothetical protein
MKELREDSFAKFCEYALSHPDAASRMKEWFIPKGKPLRRQAVRDWVLWMIFLVDPKDAKTGEWEEELERYMATIEGMMRKVVMARVQKACE